jgi:hypothetical protein
MTAVLVLTGIVVVIIAAIVLLAVPVRHAEAVANGFSWHWSVRVGTRVWEEFEAAAIRQGPVRTDLHRRWYWQAFLHLQETRVAE